ncbi:MAG: AAA family ATPase [Acidobacteria bacterium]|nr:AAA family ATPase [Acidobacteriota bacterium]MCA1619734.1 AAA family ATPase [Acidobacteriota bacterium]
MAKAINSKKKDSTAKPDGITRISVSGFKSIAEEQSIEVRPLTILAGANSSGKSSIMQPLLLLKQTLEASYDPGALRLDGPNVRFTSADQFLSHAGRGKNTDGFSVSVEASDRGNLTTYFRKQSGKPIEVQRSTFITNNRKDDLRADMTPEEIKSEIDSGFLFLVTQSYFFGSDVPEITVTRDRFFLQWSFSGFQDIDFTLGQIMEPYIREVIHVPGLRGNPERTYNVAAVGASFPGTFENYAASVIAKWQAENDSDNLEGASQDLNELCLTSKVLAIPLNDTQVELQVSRLPQGAKGKGDMVSIADVGFGVSQTLPVVVALREAKPGQLVYVEQPEIHLHPRAQTAMAKVLADAAARGVHVVAETHSALLILSVQTLVAEGKLAPELVKLHWFERRDGVTKVRSADLDEAGSFGDWPEDFADVELEAQSRYLDAVEARSSRGKKRRAG